SIPLLWNHCICSITAVISSTYSLHNSFVSASTITRTNDSVPDERTKTRPVSPSAASTFFTTSFNCGACMFLIYLLLLHFSTLAGKLLFPQLVPITFCQFLSLYQLVAHQLINHLHLWHNLKISHDQIVHHQNCMLHHASIP